MSDIKPGTYSGRVVYGFSQTAFGNMAFIPEYRPEQVLKNRRSFLETIVTSPPPLFTVRQVHGNKVVFYDGKTEYPALPAADAVITRTKRVVLGVLTADCLPVILYDRAATAAGIIHAGRVGSLNRVTGIAVADFINDLNILPRDVFVVIGPGILNCCYNVREDALTPFEKYYRVSEIARELSSGQWMLDLVRINIRQILECGVPSENISCSGVCTMCGPDYFSFRRDGTRQRFLSVVSLARAPGVQPVGQGRLGSAS